MAGIIRPMQASAPSTRYARNGSIHLAYQVLGEGPPDLLVVNSGPASHVDHQSGTSRMRPGSCAGWRPSAA